MSDNIRCPSCRGAKRVPKLGGVIGECNTCGGKGSILLADKPKPVIPVVEPIVSEVVEAVALCLPTSTVEDIKDVKIDGKRAVFKRKRA